MEYKMYTLNKIALVLAVVFCMLFFPFSHGWAQPFGILSQKGQQETQQQVLSSPAGRFVFGQVSDSNKDQFMLDTFTGRLWRISERGDIGMFLISIPYCNSEGDCSPFPEKMSDSEMTKGKTR